MKVVAERNGWTTKSGINISFEHLSVVRDSVDLLWIAEFPDQDKEIKGTKYSLPAVPLYLRQEYSGPFIAYLPRDDLNILIGWTTRTFEAVAEHFMASGRVTMYEQKWEEMHTYPIGGWAICDDFQNCKYMDYADRFIPFVTCVREGDIITVSPTSPYGSLKLINELKNGKG